VRVYCVYVRACVVCAHANDESQEQQVNTQPMYSDKGTLMPLCNGCMDAESFKAVQTSKTTHTKLTCTWTTYLLLLLHLLLILLTLVGRHARHFGLCIQSKTHTQGWHRTEHDKFVNQHDAQAEFTICVDQVS